MKLFIAGKLTSSIKIAEERSYLIICFLVIQIIYATINAYMGYECILRQF